MDGRQEHPQRTHRQGQPQASPAAGSGLKPLTPLAAMPPRPLPPDPRTAPQGSPAPLHGGDRPAYGAPAPGSLPAAPAALDAAAHGLFAPDAPQRAAWQPAGLRPATLAPAQRQSIPAPPPAVPEPPAAPMGEPEPVRRVLMQTLPQQSQSAQRYPAYPAPAYEPNGYATPEDMSGERTRRRRAASYAEPPASWQDAPAMDDPFAAILAQPQPMQPWTQPTPPGSEPPAGSALPHGMPEPYGGYAYPAPQAPYDARQAEPAPAQPDLLDDDSGHYAAIAQRPLAEPVTVPTFDSLTPRARRTKRSWLLAVLLLLLLAAGGFALYQTGLLARWLPGLFPGTAGSVPSVFGRQPDGMSAAANVTPAAQVGVPALQEIAVENPDATAPAVVHATLLTNAATTSVRLFTEANDTVYTVAYASPKGDGFLWQVEATFPEPYSGNLLVYLRDAAGQWTLAEGKAAVTVR